MLGVETIEPKTLPRPSGPAASPPARQTSLAGRETITAPEPMPAEGGGARPSLNQVKKLVEAAQAQTATTDVKLNIEVNLESGDYVVKVINRDTGELIREVPPEEVSCMGVKLSQLAGLLFDRRL